MDVRTSDIEITRPSPNRLRHACKQQQQNNTDPVSGRSGIVYNLYGC